MNTPLLIDTDILVDFLRGYGKAVELIDRHSDRILLSSIVVAELYAGVKGATELQVLDDLVSLFPVVPVNAEIARAGGLYRRDYGKSHGLGLADALLAATAEAEKAVFMTLTVKHYPMMTANIAEGYGRFHWQENIQFTQRETAPEPALRPPR